MGEQATEGVDYHRDGADLPAWALWALLMFMALPVALVIAVIVSIQ
jgi:hypothetical protein